MQVALQGIQQTWHQLSVSGTMENGWDVSTRGWVVGGSDSEDLCVCVCLCCAVFVALNRLGNQCILCNPTYMARCQSTFISIVGGPLCTNGARTYDSPLKTSKSSFCKWNL